MDTPREHSDASHDDVVDLVVDKVEMRVGDEASADEVEHAAREATERLGDPPVKTFLPLLAEKNAVRRIRDRRRRNAPRSRGATPDAGPR